MVGQPEKRARAEAILGELTELGLVAAREVTTRLRESEDVGETVALSRALDKISRAVRLTLALSFKLDRDAARDVRDAAREARESEAETARAEADRALVRHRQHKDRVRAAAGRLIWNESEDEDEAEELLERLEARLADEAVAESFEDTPIEVVVRRLLADLGLPIAPSPAETQASDPPPRTPQLADTG